jgi:ribosomal protein S18 acetylase RimI-like enzyme
MSQGNLVKIIHETLKEHYINNPCSVLANAFWKTGIKLVNYELTCVRENDEVSSIIIKEENKLLLYWHLDEKTPEFKPSTSLDFVLIHQKYLKSINLKFKSKKAYFRIIHKHHNIEKANLPESFCFKQVNLAQEVDKIVDLLSLCYPGWNFTKKRILGWKDHPVYDEKGWIWIIDEKNNRKAGLGIAEFDKTIPEASLEWIQVHPEYQDKGLGKNLVLKLLSRYIKSALFTTVSGESNNPSNPEELYRRCGFEGDDVWWVLSQ